MPFPTAVDAIVDAPPVTAATRITSSQVLGPQRITVGPIWFNPKSDQFGALGDGTTNDTAAFTAMITAMPNGSKAFLPPGTYMIDPGALANITKSIHLQGAGKDATVIQARSGSGLYIFQFSGVTGATLEDLTLDGSGMTTAAGVALFSVLTSTSVRIRNCRFQNIPSATAVNAVTLNNVQRAWVQNCEFTNLSRSGVRLEDPGVGNFNDEVWITDNHFLNVSNGGTVGNAPIATAGTLRTMNRYCHVERNFVKGALDVGIGFNSDFSWIVGNRVENGPGGTTTGECIAMQGQGNKILYNECFQKSTTTASCILLWVVSTQVNDHNEFAHNYCTGSNSGGAGAGIEIGFSVNGLTVNDLYIHDNECVGNAAGIITVGPATTGTWNSAVVTNNKLYGNVSDSGAVSWIGFTGPPSYENGNVPGILQHKQQSASGTTFTPDLTTGDYFSYSLTGNATINAPLNPRVGAIITLVMRQDGTGGRTITLNAVFKTGGFVAVNTAAFSATNDRYIFDGGSWIGLSRNTGN